MTAGPQPSTEVMVGRAPRTPDDNLFLALRTCATHPAGPLRAVAQIVEAIERGDMTRAEARELCDAQAARYRGMVNVPPDRLVVVERFLSALFQ